MKYSKNKKRNTNRKIKKRNTKRKIKKRNTKRKIKKRNYKKRNYKKIGGTSKNYYIEQFKNIDFFKQKIEDMLSVIMNYNSKSKFIFNDTDRINNELNNILLKIISIEQLSELYDLNNNTNNTLFLIFFIFNSYILYETKDDFYDKDYIDACKEIALNIYNYLNDVLTGYELNLLNKEFDLEIIDKYLNYFTKIYNI